MVLKIFFKDCLRDFFSTNLGLVWFDLVVYQVSTFYYAMNWSKSLVWRWVLKATLVFIFGPKKTKSLLQPRTKLNNILNVYILFQQYKIINELVSTF